MNVRGPARVRQPLLVGREVGRDYAPRRVEAPDGLERLGGTVPQPPPAGTEHVVGEVRELVSIVLFRV